jgi:CPA2 family monovalent cation:H+ antiporter-2
MKILQDRAETETPHGTITLGILIFQDVMIVPMMLLIPLLSGKEINAGVPGPMMLVMGIGIIALVFVSAKWVVPKVFFGIAQTRSRELFLLSVITVGFAVAWLTNRAGLSLALGAFLAGLIISESEYSHQALGNVLPFRDVFISFFFVSVGMLLDTGFLLKNTYFLVSVAAGVIILKVLVAGLSTMVLGLSLRTVVLVGLALGQVGEFSFVLAGSGVGYGLLAGDRYQVFLAVSVLTMMATPFIMMASPQLSEFALKLPLPAKIKRGSYPLGAQKRVREKEHLVIIGFGVNGRNLARAARAAGIPYVIVEMNPAAVKEERKKGERIYFGDATQEAILQHVNIKEAKAVAVVINDASATRRIVEVVRRLNPKVYLIVRTRFVQETGPLLELGADEVIPEEFETSVEIFSRVLAKYLLPKEEIERFVSEIRAEGYGMLRSLSREATSCLDLELCLPNVEIKSFRIMGDSPLVGKPLAETQMRKMYGVTLLAVRRKDRILSNPDPETVFRPNDILFVVGKPEQIAEVITLFSKGPP